jgi:multidrug efflux pump subunit AcrB
MKQIVTVVLLLIVSSAWSMPATAQIFMGPNSQKQAEKAAKKEKKTELKNAKKQQKAMRKYEKREQKAEHRKR